MAKSIRLKTPTQQRLIEAVAEHYADTGVLVSDAQMVDALVNEALNARVTVKEPKRKGERGRS